MEGHRLERRALQLLPAGSILANTDQQEWASTSCWPWLHWAYVPHTRRCRRCREDFLFSAEEQRHWWEVLGLPTEVWPRQCAPCRKVIRREKAAHAALAEARRRLEADPGDLAAELEVARATWALRETIGPEGLNRGVGAARRARGFRKEAEKLLKKLDALRREG